MQDMFPNSIITFDFKLMCIIKMSVNALWVNTIKNTFRAEQVKFIACCSEGECTSLNQQETQEGISIRFGVVLCDLGQI